MTKDYRIVQTQKDRDALEEYINTYDYFAFDTETTGLNTKTDKVVGFSISGKKGTAFYYPTKKCYGTYGELVDDEDNQDEVHRFLRLLAEKELLMWNGSFDIRMVKNNFSIDLSNSLVAEGMLLKHTVEEEGDFGLKKVGVAIQDKIGFDVENAANQEQIELKENVKKNGGSTTKAKYEMYKADLDVLGKYACKDADLTFRICEYYSSKVAEEELDDFFYDEEVMPLYKEVTIPMESKGVKLDMPFILASKEEILEDILTLEENVITSLEESEAFIEWYADKVQNIEASKGKFLQVLGDLVNIPLPKTTSGKYSFTKKNLEKLEGFDYVKDFINEGILPAIPEVRKAKEIMYLESKEVGGKKINISSKKQLGDLVFKYMKIKPLGHTEKGTPQFNDDMVDKLIKEGHKWAEYLHQYNKLGKIKGTYIDRFLDNNVDGMYYFSYKQHGTISGRYGSDAQQLPRPMEEGQDYSTVLKYNNRIRQFFVAGEGRKFIDCDYESLEPHTFAHVSGDPGLIDIFKKGHDFYSTIAIATEGLEGVSADKKAENYLGKVNKQLRQKAKAYCLGVPYGMGAYALGKTLEIETEEAEELIDNYLGAYPKLKAWMDSSKKKAHYQGFVKSEAGRVRHLEKVRTLFKKHGEKLMHFKYRMKLLRKFDKDEITTMYKDYKNGVNNSRNYQIQSMASTIVNRAMIAINRYFKEHNIDAWICTTIHDQIICNVPEELAEDLKPVIQDLMENTTRLSLELKAPPEIGLNWADAH